MLMQSMEFPNAKEARTYRRTMGCGGWIFEDFEDGCATLFSPHNSHGEVMTPKMVMMRPELRGRSGKLHH